MPLTRTEINQIVARMQTSADLGAGGISALKEVLNGINLGDAPEDGTTYGRENGAWVAVTGGSGGGNKVLVTVNFGVLHSTKAEEVVTGQTWVAADSCITCQVLADPASSIDPDDLYLYKFVTSVSDLVPGDGFTLTVYTDAEARGPFDVMCIGV